MLLLHNKDNSRRIRSKVRPCNGAQVNCKLTTAWHQDRKPGFCAVWVSYRQINCRYKVN